MGLDRVYIGFLLFVNYLLLLYNGIQITQDYNEQAQICTVGSSINSSGNWLDYVQCQATPEANPN